MEHIPNLSDDLIQELEREFPLRNPKPHEALADILHRAGERSVVEYLLAVQRRDKEGD